MHVTEPRARLFDPDTSHTAARSVTNVTEIQHRIWTLLYHYGPLTDSQLVAMLDDIASPSGVRTRRAELVKAGLVARHDQDGTTGTGRRCAMWKAVTT